jgi:hypothetical protein
MNTNNPDAALIEACDKYVEAEKKYRALFAPKMTRKREAAQEVYRDIQAGLMETIRDHEATTLEGVKARVRAADSWTDVDGEYDAEAGEILSYMIRDLLGAERLPKEEPVFIPLEAGCGAAIA